jgi:16S rRNA C1402 N4-methylase RsmH
MRYDQAHNPNSAYVVINTYSKTQLEALFMNYADFAPKKATEIAEKIVTQRKSTPLQTTQDLKTLLNSV